MRPTNKSELAHFQFAQKSPSALRVRTRRRSLIGRSRASVPFNAGSLGSQHKRQEDGGGADQLIVSLRGGEHAASGDSSQAGIPLQKSVHALQEYLMVLAPQRLPYDIQMASGWDTGYPPEELVGLMQTSVGKGWHTPRFGSYPQDLVLRFSCGHSRIRQIQILSHQYKIASKLDFWMGSWKGTQDVQTNPSGTDTVSGCGSLNEYDNSFGGDGELTYDHGNGDNGRRGSRDDNQKKSLPVLQFQKLGSISFDNNAASNYSKRELRSINFDVEGEYLRVVIRQCHANPLNIYHQVAILALNILGEPLEDELLGDSERLNFDEFEVVNGPGQGLSETSLAHLAFPVPEVSNEAHALSDTVRSLSISDVKEQPLNYMDPEIQTLVSGFIKAKLDAVKVEDFPSAKRFKSGYEELLMFADEIQALDSQKYEAAESEEFDLAQELKAKAADVKVRMYAQFALNGFNITWTDAIAVVSIPSFEERDSEEQVSIQKPRTIARSYSASHLPRALDPRNSSSGSAGSVGRRDPVSRKSIPVPVNLNRSASMTSDNNSSDPDKTRREEHGSNIPLSSSRSQGSSAGRQSAVNTSFSRILPPTSLPTFKSHPRTQQTALALDNIKENGPLNDPIPSADGSDEVEEDKFYQLSEQELKTFAFTLEAFSEKIVSCLINRDMSHRLYAIEYVKEHLENEHVSDEPEQAGDRAILARAVFQVISAALADTREKVVSMALTLLDQAVRFCVQNEVPSSIAYRSLEPILSLLLVKASDLNSRVAQGAIDRIVVLCDDFRRQPYAILPLVFKPARTTVPYRQAQSRVEIVARLVDEFGVCDRVAGKGTAGGLEFESITEFATPYLSHTNGEVRVATRKLIIDVCKFLNKTRVEQFLPGVKPLLIESIQKELEPKRRDPHTTAPSMSPAPSSRSMSLSIPRPSRSELKAAASDTSTTTTTTNSSTASTRRRQIPTPVKVNLHMDSLKSLLVEPDSPGQLKSNRQSSRQRSDAAVAHQARLKMPLRSSIKATQALYSGVPKSMVKRNTMRSPDEENESTASEDIKLKIPQVSPLLSRPTSRTVQERPRPGSLKTRISRQDLSSSEPQLSSPGNGSQRSTESTSSPRSSTAKDRMCVFCDERSEAFTDEGLVKHYWGDCVMLANCPFCKIIIEVPTLSEHMLKECPRKKFVKQCENCREIMAADTYLAHVACGCVAVPESTVKCPLCQEVMFPDGEAAWKRHLNQGAGCPMNKKKATTPAAPKSRTLLSSDQLLSPPSSHSGGGASTIPRYNHSSSFSGLPLSPASSLSTRSSSVSTPTTTTTTTTTMGRYRSSTALPSTNISPTSSTSSSFMLEKSGILQHKNHLSSSGSSHSLASLAAASASTAAHK
ncbi:hypothetical protein BGZ95_010611 [Linnemannia exigua]|uniref:TOG domain-containing protein n=1 Tax=Linnemannia exigua TaxID=604196 RepID=A0AAD4DB40_9FUNG|nr:hypothetical protein BGZ95_010611 [Linnemannia exigua]